MEYLIKTVTSNSVLGRRCRGMNLSIHYMVKVKDKKLQKILVDAYSYPRRVRFLKEEKFVISHRLEIAKLITS